MGVTVADPWVRVNDTLIVCMYDVPHLFKSIRNNLLEHDIEIDGKIVSWNVLRKIFSEDNHTIRAMHKLTPAHIDPDSFQKMKVKLATQIFSSHVSTTIYASAQTKLFSADEMENVIATAEFFNILNKAFDHLNSFTMNYVNPDKAPISEKSETLKSLKDVKDYISKWHKLGKKAFCFNGLIQTINAIIMMWNCTLKGSQSYLLTGHLNQDPLENIFSLVRNDRGSYEKNPSSHMFHSNMKHLCFHSLFSSNNTSYDVSASETLLNMSDLNGNLHGKLLSIK